MFSDLTHTWADSRGECELYGGWLVQINNLKEFNCLMRYGQKEGLDNDYWTDGNDVENTGVWTHAYDNTEVTFFGRRIGCSCIIEYQDSPVYVPCPNGALSG